MTAATMALAGGPVLGTPLSLLLLQMLVIIIVCRIMAMILGRLGQPRVVAEILAGILLGPTALSRIPAFAHTIFPATSLPALSLIANIGLILFIYITSLELELSRMGKQLRQSALISLSGIIIPFGLGAAASVHIYHVLGDPDVSYTSFMLFIATAMSVTALPVLARILTETGCIRTTVGQVALAAAAVDDVVAWTLMVVVVAILNNTGQNIFALYVFLVVVGFTAFMWTAVRPLLRVMVLRWGRHKSEGQPTVTPILLFTVLVLLLASAWFTESVCGIHALFGAVIMGVVTPHDYGFAEAIAERLEDLTTQLFLPLYFAYTGLKTQIGSLSTGTAWSVEFLVLSTAIGGKIIGCTLAGRYAPGAPFSWRESLAIGVLMSNKGLVELVILNIGLEAGVISDTVFAIMVVMAIVTTMMTQPLIRVIYPPKYWVLAGESHLTRTDTMLIVEEDDSASEGGGLSRPVQLLRMLCSSDKLRVMVCLPSTTAVSSMARITSQLVRAHPPPIATSASGAAPTALPQPRIQLTALRLLPLSASRHSAVMRAAHAPERMAQADPALSLFASFMNVDAHNGSDMADQHQRRRSMLLRTLLAVTGASDAGADDVTGTACAVAAQMVLVPLSLVHPEVTSGTTGSSGAGSTLESFLPIVPQIHSDKLVVDPEDHLQRCLVKRTVERASCAVITVMDRGIGNLPKAWMISTSMTAAVHETETAPTGLVRRYQQRVLLVFRSGRADIEALKFVARLCGLVAQSDVSLNATLDEKNRDKRSQTDLASPWKIDVLVIPGPARAEVGFGMPTHGAVAAVPASSAASQHSASECTVTFPTLTSRDSLLVEQLAQLAPRCVYVHHAPAPTSPLHAGASAADEIRAFCKREGYDDGAHDAVVVGATSLDWPMPEAKPTAAATADVDAVTTASSLPSSPPKSPLMAAHMPASVTESQSGHDGGETLQTWLETNCPVSVFVAYAPNAHEAPPTQHDTVTSLSHLLFHAEDGHAGTSPEAPAPAHTTRHRQKAMV